MSAAKPGSTTFAIDTTQLLLTETEETEINDLIARYRAIYALGAQRRVEADRGPFHLLELPGELRNRVYAYMLQNEEDFAEQHNLAYVSLPATARISKQVRQEILPIFFANSSFVLNVAANLADRSRAQAGLRPLGTQAKVQACGVLHIKQPARRSLRSAGRGALFRNVTLKACDGNSWTMDVRRKDGIRNWLRVFSLRLRVERGNLKVTIERGMAYQDPYTFRGTTETRIVASAVEEVMYEAITMANDIAAKDSFQGFTLGNLEAIARNLRFEFQFPE